MSACHGLVIKDGRYYFQARVPKDCLAAWQRQSGKRGPTYSEPLDTRDLLEARRIVRTEKWPRHYEMLQRLRAGPVMAIEKAAVDRLAAEWLVERLTEEEEARFDTSGDEVYKMVRATAEACWPARRPPCSRTCDAKGE